MDNFIPPSELQPCPECGQELVYIKAGKDKATELPYPAYYKCPNDCFQGHAGRKYKVRYNADRAQKYLKS